MHPREKGEVNNKNCLPGTRGIQWPHRNWRQTFLECNLKRARKDDLTDHESACLRIEGIMSAVRERRLKRDYLLTAD